MVDYTRLSYGAILRELRTFRGFTQKDLADYLNITAQAYSNYENNKREPSTDTLYRIAHFYGITLDSLVGCRLQAHTVEDVSGYMAEPKVFQGIQDDGFTIPITAKDVKILKNIQSLPSKQLDVCCQLIEFLKPVT